MGLLSRLPSEGATMVLLLEVVPVIRNKTVSVHLKPVITQQEEKHPIIDVKTPVK